MGRKPKGKALTLRPIRLDDDVWTECQRLGKEHGTINEGLRARLLKPDRATITATNEPETPEEIFSQAKAMIKTRVEREVAKHERPFKGPLLKPRDEKK